MPPAQTTQANVFALPVELHHQIIRSLVIEDVLALQKTCRYFFELTHEPGVWRIISTWMRAQQALPCSRAAFAAMSPSQVARTLWLASRVEASFLTRKEHVKHHIGDDNLNRLLPGTVSPVAWRLLAFISDRFLLSVDNAMVAIWDTTAVAQSSPTTSPSLWARFMLPNLICYADYHSTLCLTVSGDHEDHKSAVVYSVPLPPLHESGSNPALLKLEADFPLLEREVLKYMDPSSGRALLYCPPTSIHILSWREGNKRSIIFVELDDADQAWNGITSLRFCGPYVLCFRVRSVEAYPVPTDCASGHLLPMLRYRFGPVCFRAVSLSNVRMSRCASGEDYTIFMLANDIYQGMCHYLIRVTTSPVPSMSVRGLAMGTIMDPPLLIPGTNERFSVRDTVRRMFVSTWSLGSAGLRGVWVDRCRGSIIRRVVAFTTHPSRLRGQRGQGTLSLIAGEDKDGVSPGPANGDVLDAREPDEEASPIQGKIVYEIDSCDLRDDITICAVSEWTGKIALCSRGGVISIL